MVSKKIFYNTSWLILDKVFRMGVGMIVGLWVARYLGPQLFGTLNFSFAFVSIFSIGSSLGLDGIVVRNLVRGDVESKVLGSSLFLKFLGATISLIFSIISIALIEKGTTDSFFLIIICSLSFLFQPLDVIDYFYQSKTEARFPIIARSISFLICSLLKINLILIEAELIVFAWIFLLEFILSALIMAGIYCYKGSSILSWTVDKEKTLDLLKDSWSLALASMVSIIYMRIDQVMLRELVNETSVGIYSASVRISEIWYFIPMSICNSIAPKLISLKKTNEKSYQDNLKKLYSLMSLASICIAMVIAFFSFEIINLLYGQEFIEAGVILIVNIWAGVFVFLGVASSQYLMAENLNKLSFYRTLIGCILNIILNLLLIPDYHGLGAAVATLISYFVATFSLALFKSGRQQSILMLKTLNPYFSIRQLVKR